MVQVKSVCQIAASDSDGGAAMAAYRIHRGINQHAGGWVSHMLVQHKSSRDESVSQVHPLRSGFITSAWRGLKGRLRQWTVTDDVDSLASIDHVGYELFSDVFARHCDPVSAIPDRTDLVQWNWLAGLHDWTDIESISWPLVWRLADMNAFTGGCHYTAGCTAFKHECARCPQLRSRDTLASQAFQTKCDWLSALDPGQLTVVTQSKWMQNCVAESRLLSRFNQALIPNGVCRDDFFPLPKLEMKRALGLATDLPVGLLCSLGKFSRNGIGRFLGTLADNGDCQIQWLILGHERKLPADIRAEFIGNAPQKLLRFIYNASDLMVFPSIQDHCPNVVLEAQACGVPVLAFDGSGTAELIAEGRSGWLVAAEDFPGMVDCLRHLVTSGQWDRDDQQSEMISRSVRDADAMIKDYLKLYTSICDHGV